MDQKQQQQFLTQSSVQLKQLTSTNVKKNRRIIYRSPNYYPAPGLQIGSRRQSCTQSGIRMNSKKLKNPQNLTTNIQQELVKTLDITVDPKELQQQQQQQQQQQEKTTIQKQFLDLSPQKKDEHNGQYFMGGNTYIQDKKELLNDKRNTVSEIIDQLPEGSPTSKIDNKSQQQLHFQQIFEENSDYLKHLKGDCICGKCLCGKCKCPQRNFRHNFHKPNISIYQKEFQNYVSYDSLPKVTMDFWTSPQSKIPMQLQSTNRADFKSHFTTCQIKKAPREGIVDAPFSGVSSYKANYVDWGQSEKLNIKPPPNPTVISNLPFVGRTIYNDNYHNVQHENDPELKNMILRNKKGIHKSPMNPDFPFLGETQYMHTYLPFKTQNQNKDSKQPSLYQSNPAYYGQFVSQTKKEHANLGIINCPSRKDMHEQYVKTLDENRPKIF